MKRKYKIEKKEKAIPEGKKSGITLYKYFGTGRKRVLGQMVQNPGDIVEIPTERKFQHQLFVPLTNKRRKVIKRKF